MKKIAWVVMVMAGVLTLLNACDRQKEPIKIGLAVNLSGAGGSAGEHIRDGALQAIDDINATGGVNGRPLLLLVRDDLNTKEGIQQADESLINEGVVAIIGHSQSENTLTAYPYVTSHHTVLLTAYTAASELSGKDDLFFRTAVDCNLYGVKTAALLKDKGIRSAAFLIDMSNAAFGNDWVEQTRRHFQGQTLVVRFDSGDSPDWRQITDELLTSAPGAIILLTDSAASAKVAQFIRQRSATILLITSPWSQSPEVVDIGGQAVEGMTFVTFVNPDNDRADHQEFSRRLQENFGKKVTARSARAHEMITILANAVGRCDPSKAENIKAALLAGEYESILGRLQFDPFGDVIRPVYEVVVTNGAFKTVGEIR